MGELFDHVTFNILWI